MASPPIDDAENVDSVPSTRRSSSRHSSIRFFFLTMVVACLLSLKMSPAKMMTTASTQSQIPESTSVKPASNETTAASMVAAEAVDSVAIAATHQSSDHIVPTLYNTSNIPKWMLDYFAWHRRQLEKLHSGQTSWTPEYEIPANVTSNITQQSPSQRKGTSPRFLILRCIDGDRCGGTSDRLKAFPLFIFLAKQSNRILLIRWGQHRPFPISEFLRPRDLWNWTVPEPLLRILEAGDTKEGNVAIHSRRTYHDGTQFKNLRGSTLDQSVWVVEGNDYSGGETRYNRLMKLELKRQKEVENSDWQERDAEYANFYHDLFHASFQPSIAIQKELKGYIENLDDTNDDDQHLLERSLPTRLHPNEYMVAHYRAKYPGEPYRETWNTTILQQRAVYAVECAETRGPTNIDTVYMASDTALALEAVHQTYIQQKRKHDNSSSRVWTNLDLHSSNLSQNFNQSQVAVDPPHLNFAKLEDASGFYGIFVDLFLMSYSYCVVYGAGGFGRFGALVSFHPHCGAPFTSKNAALPICKPYQR